jgi:hypothetical protein
MPRRVRWLASVGALRALPAMHSGAQELPAPTESLRIDQVQPLGSHHGYRPCPSPQARRRLQARAAVVRARRLSALRGAVPAGAMVFLFPFSFFPERR